MIAKKVLFLGRNDTGIHHCAEALEFCRSQFSDVSSFLGNWGTKLPAEARAWKGDYVFSYLSRWVLPGSVLSGASVAAINFHPAPPEYPGIGCTNFALYEEAPEYGVTCHHMAEMVDTGGIIEVRRFPIVPEDDVESLLVKTYDTMFLLFKDTLTTISEGRPLPKSGERWTRKPFTRAELNALGELKSGMSAEEVRKRTRALTYGAWKPRKV